MSLRVPDKQLRIVSAQYEDEWGSRKAKQELRPLSGSQFRSEAFDNVRCSESEVGGVGRHLARPAILITNQCLW
jgi:hypothetical protein